MWQQPRRAPAVQTIYDAAENAIKSEDRVFKFHDIVANALKRIPEPGKIPTGWQEPLRRYLDAAQNEAALNALGFQSIAATAAAKLQARYEICAAIERNPAVSRAAIDRPIFVIGGWRTGTTLLQRLLASVPALKGMLPLELLQPWRFVDADASKRETMLEAARGAPNMLHVLNPEIMDIHPYGPDQEEECVLALGTDFKNLSFTSNIHVPSYAHWLLEQDMTDSYAIYRDVLRLVNHGDRRRLILKAPAHTASLPAIWANFPDAIVIQLHRDVVNTVTSGASLFAVFHSTYSDRVDPVEVGRYQLGMTRTWFDRAAAAREANPTRRVIDVDFREFIADPVGMVGKICKACDVDWDDHAGQRVSSRLVNLNQRHASHKYQPEDFGLTAGEIREYLAGYAAQHGL